MSLITDFVILIVTLLHIYFLILEMFLWDKPIGLRVFGQTKEAASKSKVLAANQGLYNGFLAAGLIWGFLLGSGGMDIKIFFLVCIIIAGIFGAVTANKKILYIQALPSSCGIDNYVNHALPHMTITSLVEYARGLIASKYDYHLTFFQSLRPLHLLKKRYVVHKNIIYCIFLKFFRCKKSCAHKYIYS